MIIIEFLKSIIFGIVEGITEWLPISSTGHLILLEEFLKFDRVSPGFWEVYEVVIQLGAILAVVVLFWKKIWPFRKHGELLGVIDRNTFSLWMKILVACVPAAVIGLTLDDKIDELFYNFLTVGIMLLVLGVAFIFIEMRNRKVQPRVTDTDHITYLQAAAIGLFQVVAAVLPGTSRSGATILGAILIGIARPAAAEFTFVLGIPVMFGASLLKLAKFFLGGFAFTGAEIGILLLGCVVAFAVSMVCIRFLMDYIKRHDFRVFGWYRIVLGVIVLVYALASGQLAG